MSRTLQNKALLIASAALIAGLPACGILGDDTSDPANQAQVVINGTSPVPLDLITSDEFIVTRNVETGVTTTEFLSADTSMLTVPFEQAYDISTFERFLVRLINPDSMVASIRLQVLIDGTLEYDQTADISQGASLEFSFQTQRFF